MHTAKKTAKHWYVIYTRSRTEKRVQSELEIKGIECFLPLQKKQRQWKDRKKWIETPLLPGYCFVNVDRIDYDRVLQTNNVVCYITFEGKAAVVRDDQIESLRVLLDQNDFEIDITPETFELGKKVEIIQGPLIGLKGELCEVRGKNKFLLRIEQIDKSILAEVPCECLSTVHEQSILV
ncbi:UpxY family transcription antiterminator [Maribellus sediminis]|uniref:UpxY family transcription antiterminator n=1 Tax=Maribellus sediminis TaxID=2696285 RepID=UPI00142FE117|nr:UpxY family transcription antiterminator [Maribellus sediminis]